MFLKILPYILGTLIGVYLNYNPIVPETLTLFGVLAGLIISPIVGIPLIVAINLIRLIIVAKKTDSRISVGKKLKGISRFILSLMGGTFFSCSFFTLLQGIPLYLASLFKQYNPVETPIENWNSFHYYNLSFIGFSVWMAVAIIWPTFSWIISKWIVSISERIKFSDKEERSLEVLQAILSKTRKTLWLTYGLSLAAGIPIIMYLNAWKGVNSLMLEIFPWLSWILIPIMIILVLFILLFSLSKAFNWDKYVAEQAAESSSEKIHNSSK